MNKFLITCILACQIQATHQFVRIGKVEGLILSSKELSANFISTPKDRFSLSRKDVCFFEAEAAKNDTLKVIKTYKRQYLGVVDKGRRYMFVILYPSDRVASYWKTQEVVCEDCPKVIVFFCLDNQRVEMVIDLRKNW